MRYTKIIGTIGPASRGQEVLTRLIEGGLDIVRLNFSHGSQEDYAKDIRSIRTIAAKAGRNVAIMADLQGPKIRVGSFVEGPVFLHRGDRFVLTTDIIQGTHKSVSVNYKQLPSQVGPGSIIYLADGIMVLEVVSVGGNDIDCKVLHGGELSDHKGVNVPSIDIKEPSLTEKDLNDLNFAVAQGVDWIALSYVRKPSDLVEIKSILKGTGIMVMAKIEKYQALDALPEIVIEADGIMVARGDLGVEVPMEQIPILQRDIAYMARQAGKPVVIATQMLESMTHQPRPTRAETTDVAHAIYDGADATMLSNETAVGSFPVEAVGMIDRIARTVEQDSKFYEHLADVNGAKNTTHAISHGVCEVAREVDAKAIITPTQSGETPRQVAKYRPPIPIVAVSCHEKVVRQLSMTWGVTALFSSEQNSIDTTLDNAVSEAKTAGIVKAGDTVVITAGVLVNVPGTTNMIKVHEVK